MSHVSRRQALVAPSDQRPGGRHVRVSLLRSTPPLRGFVLMGLLAALSAPTPAYAEVTEAERALLGVVSTRAAAVGGNVEAAPRQSLSWGEAALLGKANGSIVLAARSVEPAAVGIGDGARALLNPGATRGHGTASGRLVGAASVPADRED